MSWRKGLWFLAFAAIAVALVAPPAGAAGSRLTPQVFYPTKVDVSPPLRLMPVPAIQHLTKTPFERTQPSQRTLPPAVPMTDPVLQHIMGQTNIPSPLVSFEGLGDIDNGNLLGGYLTPADTEGAVGGNSTASNVYIQWVNLVWAVFDKTSGAMTAGPFPGNEVWTGFGGGCESTNDGDPIVLYDKLADRWFFSQFQVSSTPYALCFAVSTSPDPLGSYYRYEIDTGGIFPDYPKYSVWADAYYGTVNQFDSGSGTGFMALERNKMLTGDPTAVLIYFNLGNPYGGDLPVDFDGTLTPPGTGTPGIFTEIDKASWIPGLSSDSLLIWYLTPDFTNPANSCLGDSCTGAPNEIVPVATFTAPLCGGSRACIPQMGGESLDSLSDRGMYRAEAREFGDHESLVYNHTVDAGGGIAGVRWYELRSSGGFSNWSLYQQGTYAPSDGLYRWMGSIAMDHVGDIALGYSTSSSTTYTAVKYTGRLPGDPLGTMGDEGDIVDGSGATNTGYNRWGDYSAMQVDPTDDCTFYFTQMYDDGSDDTGPYPGWMWNTRVGSFKFASCSIGPTGTLQGTVTNAVTGDPVPGATVTAGASSTTTNASGFYTFTLPVGTYDMTASRFGFSPANASGVEVTEDNTTVQDFQLEPNGQSWVDGYVTDAGHGWPLYASINITAAPSFSTTIYSDPFTGYYSILLDNGYNYTFTVNAVTTGYQGQARPVSVTGSDQSQNFALAPVSPACAVAGYGPPPPVSTFFSESFDDGTLPSGWSIVNNGGDCVWDFSDVEGHGNLTGGTGPFAEANSDYCGPGSFMDTELRSPVLDLSAHPAVLLQFDTYYYSLGDEADVDVSADGGTTWQHVFQWTSSVGPSATEEANVSTLIGGSSQAMIRFHYYNAYWAWYWFVDNVSLADVTACSVTPGGLVGGFVSDSNTGDALNGAKVADDLGANTLTMATPNDPNIGDGYYSIFAPTPTGDQPPGQRTFTVSMSHYASATATFPIVPNTITRKDYALSAGWFEMNPTSLSSRLYVGQDEHQMMTLTNQGDADANFKLTTPLVKITWPHMSPVKLVAHQKVPSTGRARFAPHPAGATHQNQLTLDSVPGYAEDLNAGMYGTWPDLTDPSGFTPISSESALFFAGCFLNGDFSMEYALDYNTNTLQTVDTTTGAATVIGPSNPNSGESWTGMTSTPDGTMYASATTCGSSTLYTIDPSTGTATPVGAISNAPCMIDIAADADGNIFGVDIINDVLVQVDPTTGAGTVIGPTGINANYAQGMAFDTDTGTLWWAAFNNDTFQGELRVIDTSTGASTLVGTLPGGDEFDAFAIPTGGGGAGLPWLVLDPTEGTVSSGASQPIDAHFIADGAQHFGSYQASVKLSSDTPYSVDPVPVCFTKAFTDMAPGAFADKFVHGLAGARITTGCGNNDFCPGDAITRGVMARWIELARHGADYAPPPCTGIFSDVPCESTPNADYIEAFYNEGITAGCYYNPDTGERRYCPNDAVLRQQMAVFIDVAKGWPGQDPCVQIFDDAPCTSSYTPFINTLYSQGVTAGCGNNNFCGPESNTRAQMSVFIDVAWTIPTCQ